LKETLIVYGTRYGATPEACAVIQKILEKEYNQHVEIWDLGNYRACPDLDEFDNVIVSSSIEYGEWTENAEKFLEERKFDNKKLAVFISSYYAGEEDLYDHAHENFLMKILNKYDHVKPVKVAAFGGRIPKKDLPNIADQRLLGRIPEHQNDNRDWDKIEAWAHEVGKIFSED
jgi:menaquinone-dependent protoporphyrinogen IX oxidase